MRPTTELFRTVNTGTGRRLATFRRLLAIGPWTIYLGRYRPGTIDTDAPKERIP